MQCCCTSLVRDKRGQRGELWEEISTHLSRKGAGVAKEKVVETHGFAITVFARFSLNFIFGCQHERIDLNQGSPRIIYFRAKRPFYPGFDLYQYSII